MEDIRYINELNLKEKRVLIRTDFNVPFDEKGNKYWVRKVAENEITLEDTVKTGESTVIPKKDAPTFYNDAPTKPPTAPQADDYDDTPYRTPTNDDRGTENLTKAEKWFKERFPNIDFRRVVHLIDGKHHGQLREAAIYIYENAEIGTTYHEAFHVVTQVFLTRRERRALYHEHRQRFPQHKNSKDKVVEEHLAEMFREYMLIISSN